MRSNSTASPEAVDFDTAMPIRAFRRAGAPSTPSPDTATAPECLDQQKLVFGKDAGAERCSSPTRKSRGSNAGIVVIRLLGYSLIGKNSVDPLRNFRCILGATLRG